MNLHTKYISTVIVSFIVFCSCSKENREYNKSTIREIGLTINGPDEEVQEVVVYVFDQNDNFVDTLNRSLSTNFTVTNIDNTHMTFVFIGNVPLLSSVMPRVTAGDPLAQLYIKLNSVTEGQLEIAEPPFDLFYGMLKIDLTNTSAMTSIEKTVPVARKVAKVRITVKDIQHKIGSNDISAIKFHLSGTRQSMLFTGKITGDIVSYRPRTTINAKGDLSTSFFNVFPAVEGDLVLFEIYNGDQLIYSVRSDSTTGLSIIEGGLTDIYIDFSGTQPTVNTNIHVGGTWTNDVVEQEF